MAVLFNGTTQFVDIAGITSLANVDAWSITGWCRLNQLDSTRVIIDISVGTSTGSRACLQFSPSGQLQVQARGSDSDGLETRSSAAGLVVVGGWHHYAGCVNLNAGAGVGTMVGYIDGVQVVNEPATFDAATTSNTPSVSGYHGQDAAGDANQMAGALEDLRVYSRLLGPAEILSMFAQRGKDAILFGRQNQWYLKEQPSGTIASGVGTIIDIGPNRKNGNPIGNPVYEVGTVTTRKTPKMSIGIRR